MQCPTLRPEFARGDVALLCGCSVSWGAVVWDSRKGLCRNAGAVGGVELLLVRVSSQHAVIFPMQTRQLHVNIHHGYIYLKLKRCKKKNADSRVKALLQTKPVLREHDYPDCACS